MKSYQRSRKSKAPFGWTQVKRMDKNGKYVTLWRCPYVNQNWFTKKYERCYFTCRKDRTTIADVHKFKISPEFDDGLDVDYKLKAMLNTNSEFVNSLREAVAMFAGSCSISITAVCSKACRNFIIKLIKITRKFIESNHDLSINLESIVPIFNKNLMREEILRCGDKSFDTMLGKLRNFRYVNLMIDATTVHSSRIVHSTVSNPFSHFVPLPFRTVKK